VAVGDARALPVRDGACDNVVFVAALHAIRDVEGAMAEAERVVRPGGRVVVIAAPDPKVRPDGDEFVPLLAELPPHQREVPPLLVAAAAATAGLRPYASKGLIVGSVTSTPNQLADDIETRTWSNLWNVDGVVWATVVEPVIARLRALPEPDEPRDRPAAVHLSVFER
jgi:SAM-dependent methyltransferase